MNKLRIIGETILKHHPNGFFSIDQIEKLTKFSRKYLADTLVVLSKEGVIRKVGKHRQEHIPGHSLKFSLVYIANKKALAARIAPKLKEETNQDRMWFIIRKKRYFTLRDLTVLTGVKKATARWFLKALRRMEIIKPLRSEGRGIEWMLIHDCGPRRPYIETNRKAKDQKMKDKAESPGHKPKIDSRLHILLSKEEHELIKKQATMHNLSISAYFRMLIHKGLENEGKSKTFVI